MDDPWKYFFVHEHPHIFSVLPYHFLFTILIEVTRQLNERGFTMKEKSNLHFQWANISFTFGWNYMDTFIMMISIGLAARFRQINQRLEELKNQVKREKFYDQIDA